MNEVTKATVQSFIRAGINAFAGVWAVKNPNLAGGIEAFLIAGIALIWTWLDNRKKSPPTPPPTGPSITATLGLFVLIAMCSGCASNFGAATKKWDFHEGQSVLKSVKEYANGQLIREESYAVFEPQNVQTKWRSSNRALALADSKNDVNKARSSTTEKTVSAGFDQATQETKSDVVPNAVKAVGEAAPGIIKSAAGIP